MKPKSDKYFSYIYGYEIDRMSSETQIAVYRSIKSFTPNGADEIALSFRDIQERTKLSLGSVKNAVDELIGLGIIKKVRKSTRLGGSVFVYKCSPPEHFKRSLDEHLDPESVQQLNESVQTSGTKKQQDKREYIEDKTSRENLLDSLAHKAAKNQTVDTKDLDSTEKARLGLKAINLLQRRTG